MMRGLLERLLIDRTTGPNILWATDDYVGLGPEYQRDRPIEIGQITEHTGLIRIRAAKAKDRQKARARKRSEIPTPMRICNQMINALDENLVGRPDLFNKDGVPTERAEFPEMHPWMEHVGSTGLEITCSEAPFLVSRYDAGTGEAVASIRDRIGILDHKLRVEDENTVSGPEWMKWTVRAFEATYGYEYQGDSLLIARINLLATFENYLRFRWGREPSMKEYSEIIRIITWNIWQMDGLTGMVPCNRAEGRIKCRIYDWRGKRSQEFSSIGH